MKGSLRTAFIAWIGISALVIASEIALYLRNGVASLNLYIQQQWPLSNLAITLASMALTWISIGVILYLLVNERINAKNVFFVAGFFLVILVYLNILCERFHYGDYAYYIKAATVLLKNQTLPDTYFYLPLWATILPLILPLGNQGVLREVKEELGLDGEIVSIIGHYAFELRNQITFTYHIRAEGEITLGDELEYIKPVPPEEVVPWDVGTGPALKDWLAARNNPESK